MSTNVDELVTGCLNNDRICQKKLYDEYSPALFAVCRRYSNSVEDAEDVLLEGFMNIFKNLKSYRKDSSLFTWMKAVIVNTAIDHYRKSRKYTENQALEEEVLSDITDSGTAIFTKLDARQILQIVEQMPEDWRIIFNLRVMEDFSFKEIAQKISKNENSVRVYFLRAKNWLNEKLKNENI